MSDAPPPPAGPGPGSGRDAPSGGPLVRAGRSLLAALTLLTIVPVPAKAQAGIGAREVAASAVWFPLVGALLGALVGVAGSAVAQASPILGGAVVAVLMAVLTGALHLDGLADSADALGARGGSRERRLEIMRDPATGVYGTVAIVAWFLLVATACAAPQPQALPVVLAVAMATARHAAVQHALQVPPARADGLGAGFAPGRGMQWIEGLVFGGVLISIALLSESGGGPGSGQILAFFLVGLVAGLLMNVAARRLIGGRTGDTLGATVAVVEVAALVAWACVR